MMMITIIIIILIIIIIIFLRLFVIVISSVFKYSFFDNSLLYTERMYIGYIF